MRDFEQRVADFQEQIEPVIRDPEGVHHEFTAGDHGQKLDYDEIPTFATDTRFDPLYGTLVSLTAEHITRQSVNMPQAVIGTAIGANRIAVHTATLLSDKGRAVEGYATVKDHNNRIFLPPHFIAYLQTAQPRELAIIDDVGTTGSSMAQIVEQVRTYSDAQITAYINWQRQSSLPHLDALKVPYYGLITKELPTYNLLDCVRTGFCAKGWKLVPRKK